VLNVSIYSFWYWDSLGLPYGVKLEAHRDPRRDAPEGRFGAISAISGCAPQVALSDGLSGSDQTQALRTSP
jgi:hypothetical protein